MAEQALLLRWPNADALTQVRQLQLALNQCDWVIDVIAASTTLAIIGERHNGELSQLLQQWMAVNPIEKLAICATQHHALPVCYHPSLGLDLDKVAAATKLSVAQIIEYHHQTLYTVDSTAFSPGFAYLAGLHPSLQLPRRETPRLEVAAGSVAIAASHSAIYPQRSAAGWHIIGSCPEPLLNLTSMPPCRFQLGDTVSFEPISLQQYQQWSDSHD
ncbi:5-oxoprolinase subunit B family protein [Ferrimonas lipolytica]|uniref:Carboxyltransferase domain-containing protein n=1 Tax=Ferrimonas lipolytica TaxID=2724191 RepID=A0A6H1UDH3_9GAMM|nr:carboxyltransferase domain-containing protein [Ferrimonas lipolytica]QIZ77135.1 carboxyltransferase domain-containing protein [Ferrimonas lipolytica]